MKSLTKPLSSHIFLIGYMASGKTTFGRALAKALGCDFIDLDHFISEKQSMSIKEIFSNFGEARFRELETEALNEIITSRAAAIVACGGGTPCFGENMSLMKQSGITVWLNAPMATILRRLREDRSGRPLVAQLDEGNQLEEYVADNLCRREPFYSRAAMHFDSSRLESIEEIEESIEQFISLFARNEHPNPS